MKRQAGRGERKRWWLAILSRRAPPYTPQQGDVPCRRCVQGDGRPAGHVQTIMLRAALALFVYRRDLAVRTRARPWFLPFLIAIHTDLSHLVDF
jgi:hypothetical protein